MKVKTMLAVAFAAAFLSESTLIAASKPFPVRPRITVIRDGVTTYQTRGQTYYFAVEVIDESSCTKAEQSSGGRPLIQARKDERYAVRLHNPLPVRVAANLSIDGLNSINGKPSGISDGAKWIIEPHSYITVRGWQVNQGELRRFFFTEKPKSYAAWRSDAHSKDLTVNCGVIGAAYFWNKQELQSYFDERPEYVWTAPQHHYTEEAYLGKAGAAPVDKRAMEPQSSSLGRRDSAERKMQAGTGMGERESHPTHLVDFHYDTGMYKLAQAVVLYYDFQPEPRPNPFPDLSYAPEMPR